MTAAEISCPVCGYHNPPQRFCGDCGTRLPVVCPSCGTDNPGDRRHCGACGTLLPGRCASCGADNPSSNRFCHECGSPLGGKAAAPAGKTSAPRPAWGAAPSGGREERRLVTALFCDLVGFTPLSETLDAEQVREIQTAYFERMSAEIVRFGGTVEKFAGDAVLALFGVPTAHEDDAEWAVRCALSMQQALGSLADDARRRWQVDLGLRVGVNTGEAVGGMLDAGGRHDFSVTGDVVNTAARLQTAAAPGGIMVGAETMRLAERSVHFGEREDLSLKGKAGTVAAYPVLGLRERLAERWETRERMPLVGREREMDILLRAWTHAREGEGQLITIVADAGIGKSRLALEASERIAQTDEVRQLRARCLSHSQDISLWLVADLLRAVVGVREQDEPAQAQMQLTSTIEDLLPHLDPDTRAAAVDVLGEVLGLPARASPLSNAGAQARRQVLIRGLLQILAALSDQQPTLLILEDLHWIDEASADVLGKVLANVRELRLLVVAGQRPGWTAPWSGWSWVERLNLRPLEDGDAVAVAAAVLGVEHIAPDLAQYVAERAGGNPFFVEELLHALEETGGIVEQHGEVQLVPSAAERLPTTLTGIVLARLDRLDDRVRGLVQMASVVGRVFAVDLLAQVAGTVPEDLEEPLGILPAEEIAFPRPGENLDYVFKQATIRDVAYNTLLLKQRQELHAATAHALARMYTSDEYVELIASHFARSEDHGEAARWLEMAGDRAAGMFANQTAIAHYEEARKRLALCGSDEKTVPRVGEKLGRVFRIISWYEEALEELEEAAQAYSQLGDDEAELRTVAEIGRVHFLRGTRQEGIIRIGQTLGDRPEWTAPSPGVVALHTALADLFSSGGRSEAALSAAEQASSLARSLDDERLLARTEVRRGAALAEAGRLQEAKDALAEALELSERAGDLESQARALASAGDVALDRGFPEGARAYHRRALEVEEERGDLAQTAFVLGRLGQVLFVLGDWERARDHLERAVELVRSISFSYFSAPTLMALGEQYLVEGDRDSAARYLEEPFTIAERSGQLEQIPYLQVPLAARDLFEGRPQEALARLQPLIRERPLESTMDHRAMQIAADALLEMKQPEEAAALLQAGSMRADEQGNRLARLGWLAVAGSVDMMFGRHVDALRSLDEALAMARGMPYPFQEALALLAGGGVLVAQGDAEQGRERLTRARDLFQTLGARPHMERTEKQLEELATV